jgi:hypothetical protein
MAVGLLRPTAGTSQIFGVDVRADPVRAKGLVGVLPDGMLGADGGRRPPTTPFGAVLGKELRLWIGVFTGLLPLLGGSKVLLPWSGVIVALFAGALSANLYGMDAGALWLTMVAPGWSGPTCVPARRRGSRWCCRSRSCSPR